MREISLAALSCALAKDLTRKLGISPDWESNWQPFSPQDGTPTNNHWPGQKCLPSKQNILLSTAVINMVGFGCHTAVCFPVMALIVCYCSSSSLFKLFCLFQCSMNWVVFIFSIYWLVKYTFLFDF